MPSMPGSRRSSARRVLSSASPQHGEISGKSKKDEDRRTGRSERLSSSSPLVSDAPFHMHRFS